MYVELKLVPFELILYVQLILCSILLFCCKFSLVVMGTTQGRMPGLLAKSPTVLTVY